jgi:hypothetical protein
MPSVNFKAQFADAVQSGAKRQTIRVRGKRIYKVGDTLHLFTGLRGHGTARRLGSFPCMEVLGIRIDTELREVHLEKRTGDSRYLAHLFDDEATELARADGFDSLEAFFAFFNEAHGRHFGGVLLKW